MDQQALSIGAKCFSVVLSDVPWQTFGLKGRPQRGSLFQRFRSSWKVELENRLARELVIAMYGAHINGGYLSNESAKDSYSHAFSGYGIFESFGYSSKDQAVKDFESQLLVYTSTSKNKWGAIFFLRVAPQGVPDKKLKTKLMFACSQFEIDLPPAPGTLGNRDGESTADPVESVFDRYFKDKKIQDEEKEALIALANYHADAISRGSNSDELPNGIGEFGLEVTNPVPTNGITSSKTYLKRLRVNGQRVLWDRVGSFTVDNIEMPVDGYEIFDQSTNCLATIYISPYHQKTSAKAPQGVNPIPS